MFSTVSGMMSKQIITSGQDVVLFIMEKSPTHSAYSIGVGTLRSNNGSTVLYRPISLPIKCKMNELSVVSDIEENDHTKELEKKYNMNILDLIKNIYVKKWGETDSLSHLTLGFEHLEIFNVMVKKSINYHKNDVLLRFNIALFEELNAVQVDNYEKSLLSVYTLNNKNFEFEGIFSKSSTSDTNIDFSSLTYSPASVMYLYRSIKKYINIIQFDNKNRGVSLKKQKNEIDDIIKNKNLSRDDLIAALTSVQNNQVFDYLTEEGFNSLDEIKNTSSLLLDGFFNEEFFYNYKDESLIEKHFAFIDAMSSTNSLFMPTYSSFNDCEETYCRSLYYAVLKFVK